MSLPELTVRVIAAREQGASLAKLSRLTGMTITSIRRVERGWIRLNEIDLLEAALNSIANELPRHRECATTEYAAYHNMLSRCHNTNHPNYALYGGRGIIVCSRWRSSYIAFLADVGRKPSPELQLDRIDNDGNYEPGNVRWATRSQQALNRRSSHAVRTQGTK
jgi:hypothetical protein